LIQAKSLKLSRKSSSNAEMFHCTQDDNEVSLTYRTPTNRYLITTPDGVDCRLEVTARLVNGTSSLEAQLYPIEKPTHNTITNDDSKPVLSKESLLKLLPVLMNQMVTTGKYDPSYPDTILPSSTVKLLSSLDPKSLCCVVTHAEGAVSDPRFDVHYTLNFGNDVINRRDLDDVQSWELFYCR